MVNTTNSITLPASTTGVVVQTIAKAAGKTFIQAALAVLLLLAVPEFSSWVNDVQEGTPINIDLNFWRNVGLAALGGGLAALISFLMNFFSKTLPANTVVEAEVKP
jgi:hypothetical protein